MNSQSAQEWLVKAYHDLDSSQILFKSAHYTDTVGYVLQQSIEKILKSFLAYENKSIKKTHNLIEIYETIGGYIALDEYEIKLLSIATNYNTGQRYPTPHKKLPPKEEIKEVLEFTEELLARVCNTLNIDKKDIVDEK